jgi:hypothetical protein
MTARPRPVYVRVYVNATAATEARPAECCHIDEPRRRGSCPASWSPGCLVASRWWACRCAGDHGNSFLTPAPRAMAAAAVCGPRSILLQHYSRWARLRCGKEQQDRGPHRQAPAARGRELPCPHADGPARLCGGPDVSGGHPLGCEWEQTVRTGPYACSVPYLYSFSLSSAHTVRSSSNHTPLNVLHWARLPVLKRTSCISCGRSTCISLWAQRVPGVLQEIAEHHALMIRQVGAPALAPFHVQHASLMHSLHSLRASP